MYCKATQREMDDMPGLDDVGKVISKEDKWGRTVELVVDAVFVRPGGKLVLYTPHRSVFNRENQSGVVKAWMD